MGFVVATVALAFVAVDLTLRPASTLGPVAAAVLLAGLLASYALALTTGLLVLHLDSEPVDGLQSQRRRSRPPVCWLRWA